MLMVSIILVACSSVRSQTIVTAEYVKSNPMPTPNFLIDITNLKLEGECVVIDQTKIWEPGSTLEQLQNQIYQSAKVILDGSVILSKSQIIPSFSLSGAFILDESGN